MKITHLCLAGIVTDNWSYQDNLLPKYHMKLGHEVSLVTSQYIWNSEGEIEVTNQTNYINNDGIRTIRLKIRGRDNFYKKWKKYQRLDKVLSDLKPDILFIHGVQFADMSVVTKYIREHKDLRIYVDNHADFSNSASNWLSKNILHKILWRRMAKKILPYTTKFYGVLPARVDFLHQVYKIPKEKVDLLLMGVDDENLSEENLLCHSKKIRNLYGIRDTDFLIVTGGKIDNAKKQVLLLMEAVKKINVDSIKLIIFGPVAEDVKDSFLKFVDQKRIIHVDWIDPSQTNYYLAAANIAVFPGRHSVLWEQAVGLGIPCIFKFWEGTRHVDIGGNCKFLYHDNIEELTQTIISIYEDETLYREMQLSAKSGKRHFLYSEIAKKSIDHV